GLFFLGLFPQDRWLFFLSISPYLAFVSYKMTGKNGQYFWFVAAFVSMMITTAGPSSEHAFEFAVFRTLETMIGIVIWTLVSVFIWPRSNRGALEKISQSLLAKQQVFLYNYKDCIVSFDSNDKLLFERSQNDKQLSQLAQTIAAAASESFEVREIRHLWERLHGVSLAMMESMDRLQAGYTDLQAIDVERVLPELHPLFSEFKSRFEQAQSTLDRQTPLYVCNTVPFSINDTDYQQLDQFQRASIQLARNELDKLDKLSREMLACVREIAGYEGAESNLSPLVSDDLIRGPFGLPVLDPDRIRASLMVVVSMWVGALIWIYLNPPGHVSWYQFVPNVTLIAAQNPQFKLNILKPFAYAYLAALVVYVFIMPQLSMFWELGLVIFVFTFAAAYFFSGIGRTALYLSMFNMFGIENQQSYDFASQANSFLFTMLALLLVFALTYIARSPRQEKAFLSMISRYFRSCEFLISRVSDTAPAESVLERMKLAYYRQELRLLPMKLAVWGGQIDPKKFPNTSTEQISDMVASLQTLSYRIEALRDIRYAPQAEVLTKALRDDMREWRVVIERGFRQWSVSPEAESADDLRVHLLARQNKLNVRFEEILNSVGDRKISAEESRNFYQLLGNFQSLSQAAIAYADTASNIDWLQWREERF
ncbi:MAG: hypothetical protein GQ529_00200, partial [Methyloprofundus sp.]|nr:hypothetical protein [Methyloprofundus sp.]